jgi:hypothetical protein
MSEQIGPQPCYECGGEYGEHSAGCPVPALALKHRTHMVGEIVSEAESAKAMFLPVLRVRYGDDVSFSDALGLMYDEVKDLPKK